MLSVLAGEMTIAEAARREKASGQSIGRWKADFLEAGETALTAGRSRPSAREQQLEAEVAGLAQALGEPRPGYGSGTSPRSAGWALSRRSCRSSRVTISCCWSAPEVVPLWAYLDSTCPAGLGPAVSASRAACQAESLG